MAPLPAPEPFELLDTVEVVDARKLRFERNRIKLPMGVEASTPIGSLIRLRSKRSLRASTTSTVSSSSKGSGAGSGAMGSGEKAHQHGG